jgi:beta-lactamase superfamily II metal-dependent hydrolase
MKKLVIFNVGGALSCYGEIDEHRFVIDLGKSSNFSPVDDFLLPLAKAKCFHKDPIQVNKYKINQLFISHLDNDHTSDYVAFDKNFTAGYMTCPSDNNKMESKFKINREKIGELTENKKAILNEMQGRTPSDPLPLKSIIPNTHLSFINPTNVENDYDLDKCYANNISLTLFLECGDKTVLLLGDLLKEGTEYLIKNNPNFYNLLSSKGVDYLVAPHHGLQSSFSTKLFETIKGNKTRLNIISEKTRESDSDENRSDVDVRYYSSNYSTADNALNQYGVKTSQGHIVVDLESEERDIKQYTEIAGVIAEFS